MSFELVGLTRRQQLLADMLWACGTREDIERFIQFLPTQEIKEEAATLVELMIFETIDQCYDGLGSMEESQKVLDKIMR
jgi:hypothetical protein